MCGIMLEMLKAGGEAVVQWLTRVLQYGVVESGCGRMQPFSPYIGRAVEWYAQIWRNKCNEYCGEGVCEGFE